MTAADASTFAGDGDPGGGGVAARDGHEAWASFAQERLWFLDQLQRGLPVYNMSSGMSIPGPLDTGVLSAVLKELAGRHEALRTGFVARGGRPVQHVAPEVDVPLDVVDVSHLGPGEREDVARRAIAESSARPFDLAVPPLVRATLVRFGPADHYLVLTMHHIVSDGWSVGVVQRELGLLYDAFAAGRPSPLPPPALTYRDFARWQREHLQGPVLEELAAYWRAQLDGAPAVLDLPTDRPRPPVQSFVGATHAFSLPAPIATGLDGLARREGATLFMALVAGFVALLHRYADVDDVVVGTPIANRTRAELEDLVGFFVNTLVLRTDCSGDPGFAELVRRVREVTLGAYAHQDMPFEKLVEELRPERSLSHNPLFQVMFVFQNAPSAPAVPVPGDGSPSGGGATGNGTAKFDLTLSIAPGPGGLDCSLEYSTDLFDADTVARMATHLRALLSSAVADPRRPLSRLSMLTPPERRRLLVDWNRTERPVPDVAFHRMVEAQVDRDPGATAVVSTAARLTYGELDRRANRLAHRLRALGVGPDVRVGLGLDRSVDAVVAVLAVLKAGGAYVALDPDYPAARLAFVAGDARVPVLVTRADLADRLPAVAAHRVLVDDPDGGPAAWDDRPKPVAGPDDLCYVLYTSGSTGQPKGAMLVHRGLTNMAAAVGEAFGVVAGDRVLQFSSLNFDASIFEMAMALAAGAELHLGTTDELAPGDGLADLLAARRVTIATLPPSALAALPARAFPDLHTIVVAGEACPPGLVASWARRRRFCNAYGPTEATVWASAAFCAPSDGDRATVPIGWPIPNVELHVLDRHGDLAPVGVPGELHIGGAGLARGYLDRPELTEERFVPHPFAPGRRLYRSGDLVKRRSDGALEFLGRLDDQVKLRGFRIELGEVEAGLAAHPGVAEAVAAVHRRDDGEPVLVAYVTAAGEAPSPTALRAHLRGRLPEHMVPQAYVVLDRLPLTPSGKVDRRALPAPDGTRPDLEAPYVAARTPTEVAVAAIWAEVLRVERVGVHDDFFDLGGHSLLATQVLARVRATTGADIPLRALFEGPTVAELAAAADAAAAVVPGADAIRPAEDTGDDLLAHLDDMTDEEIEALLGRLAARTDRQAR